MGAFSNRCPRYKDSCNKFAWLKTNIIAKSALITHYNGSITSKGYHAILTGLPKRKKRLERKIFKYYLETNFADVGCNKIDCKHRDGFKTSFIQDQQSFAPNKQESLASLLCQNDYFDNISKAKTQANRDKTLRYMIQICFQIKISCQIYQCSASLIVVDEDKMDKRRLCPKICQSLQCPWCFHNEALPSTIQNFALLPIDTFRRHIANQYLRHRTFGNQCLYRCEIMIRIELQLKNNLRTIHKLYLF